MPKLFCPCGYMHNLSGIPDDGWLTVPDMAMENYLRYMRLYQEGFDAPGDSPEGEESNRSLDEVMKIRGRLYECPECGRIMWRKSKYDSYRVFAPERQDESTKSQVAEDISDDTDLKPNEFRCPSRKTVVPATASACPQCGWTWMGRRKGV